MNKQWTDESLDFLRANWLTMSSLKIAHAIGFNATTVRRKALALGLEQRKEFWTQEKIDLLRNNWQSMQSRQISGIIDAKISAVKHKAKSLGLRKNDFWTEDRIAFISEKWSTGMRAKEIANELGCSKNSVIGKAHRLKLATKRSEDWGFREQEQQRRKVERLAKKAVEKAQLPQQTPSARDLTRIFDLSLAGLIPLNVSFADLKRGQCHWPLGDTVVVAYCGHPTIDGLSYCAPHYCMAYQPTNGRVRAKLLEST